MLGVKRTTTGRSVPESNSVRDSCSGGQVKQDLRPELSAEFVPTGCLAISVSNGFGWPSVRGVLANTRPGPCLPPPTISFDLNQDHAYSDVNIVSLLTPCCHTYHVVSLGGRQEEGEKGRKRVRPISALASCSTTGGVVLLLCGGSDF